MSVSFLDLFANTGVVSYKRPVEGLEEAVQLLYWARGITDTGMIEYVHTKNDADLIKLSKVCDVLITQRGLRKGGESARRKRI